MFFLSGYNNTRISTFVTRAEQEGISPVAYLLIDFGKNDNATVGVLYQALRNMGGEDVMRALQVDTREHQALYNAHDHHGNREPLLL